MENTEELIENTIKIYVGKPGDLDLSNVSLGKELEDDQKKILLILKEIIKIVEKPKEFIKKLKPVIKKNKEEIEENFIEPYLDDFINVLLLDIFKRKVIDKKKFEKLKKKYKEEGIDIYI